MIDWKNFKKHKFAVKCSSEDAKNKFFTECKEHNIHIFMGDFERQRNIFICHYAYADRFSEGRYELWGIEEYAIKEYGFYQGIEIVDYKE